MTAVDRFGAGDGCVCSAHFAGRCGCVRFLAGEQDSQRCRSAAPQTFGREICGVGVAVAPASDLCLGAECRGRAYPGFVSNNNRSMTASGCGLVAADVAQKLAQVCEQLSVK